MKPGPELDALVAEKVTGWYHETEPCAPFDSWWFDNPELDGTPMSLPRYSTDIDAAWTVDKPGWLWEFQESPESLVVMLYTSREAWWEAYRSYPIIPARTILIRQEWLDDKARTYAWLRCLAALEAAGMEDEPVIGMGKDAWARLRLRAAEWGMNHEKLLAKYIEYIGEMEGTDYLGFDCVPTPFTEAEWDELRRLA